MSPHQQLFLTGPVLPPQEHSQAANAAAEVLLVFLIMIVIWAAFRITSKKRP